MRQREDNISYAVYFVSKNLSPTELNYIVTKKELLAVVHAIGKFRHYITGYETFFHTDHSAVRFLMKKPTTNGRITRWLFPLQKLNITIIDRLGRDNLVADFLSRLNLTQGSMPRPMLGEFPDEALFSISTITPWFPDVANYLVLGKLPQNLSAQERHNILQHNVSYSWIEGDVFYTRPDLIMRQFLHENEMHDILSASHNKPCGGHFSNKRMEYKVLHTRHYWLTLFKDTKMFFLSCDTCQ